MSFKLQDYMSFKLQGYMEAGFKVVKIGTKYYGTENKDGKNVSEKRRMNADDEQYRKSLGGTDYKTLMRYMPFLVAGAALFLIGWIEIIVLFVSALYSSGGYLIQSIVFLIGGLIFLGVGMKQRDKALGIHREAGRPLYKVYQAIAWIPLSIGLWLMALYSTYTIIIGISGLAAGIILLIISGVEKRKYLVADFKESSTQKNGATLIPP
jgi:hypothetical protein